MIKRGAVFLLIICLSISIYGDHKKNKKSEAKQSITTKKNNKESSIKKKRIKKKQRRKRLKSKFISKEKKKEIRRKRRKRLKKDTKRYQNRLKRLKKKYKVQHGTNEHPIVLIDEINGKAVYQGLDNVGSTKTISADIAKTNEGLTGDSIRIGVWDGGKVLETHVEFEDASSGSSKVTIGTENGSEASYNDHATHVAGTIIATGIDEDAEGFATSGTIISYDFYDDITEMETEASDNDLLLSNHSYGLVAGWESSSTYETDCWYGDTSISTTEDHKYGKYIYSSYQLDNITYGNGNYTIVKAAGNDRGDDAYYGGDHAHSDDCSNAIYSDSHEADGGSTGYDSISGDGGAKNIITVGAVYEVSNGWTSTSDVTMSTFSGWGPMDDGRIKPDIVAKGVSVYSPRYTGDSSEINEYISKNGTSMATPAITGAIGLLLEYQDSLDDSAELLSSTVKGLIIHSADEAGDYAGPDYKFGWGVANIHKSIELMKRNNEVTNNIIQEIEYDGNDQTIELRNVSPSSPLVVTAVWTDPPYSDYVNFSDKVDPTTKTLINDIDISLTQDATTYYPWSLDVDNPANGATNTTKNDTDNVEQIYIENPTGNYTLTISHDGSLYDNDNQFISLFIDYAEKPAITIPDSLSSNSSSFDISGTAISNSTIQIYVNNELQSTTTSDDAGNWSGTASFTDNGTYTIQAMVTENMNTRVSNQVEEITTTSNILSINYAGILLESPETGDIIYTPTFNVTGITTDNVTIYLYRDETNLIDSTVSDALGNIDHIFTNDEDGTFEFMATANIDGTLVTSNTIKLEFDIYLPRISSPNADTTIVTPTFNITGSTEPNVDVEIYEDSVLTASGISNSSGTFNIEVTYDVETGSSSHEYMASASVTVAGIDSIKNSKINTYDFDVPYSHPVISTPTTGTTFTTETFTITGNTMANIDISILENGAITANTTTDNNGDFELEINAPIVTTSTDFEYTITANIYEINRTSDAISLTFDTYKPIITLPTNNTTITTPTFNIIGYTSANVLVEIYQDDALIVTDNADSNGDFSIEVRYDFDELEPIVSDTIDQEFHVSASVTINDTNYIKKSDYYTYNFEVDDLRPIITTPDATEIITKKLFYIEGSTSSENAVYLYEEGELIDTVTSDSSGFFTFTVESPSNQIETEYLVSANVYEITETANVTLNFNYEIEAPTIIIPDNYSTISEPTFEISGTAEADSRVYIYQNDELIASTLTNTNGNWTNTLMNNESTSEYQAYTYIDGATVSSNIILIYTTTDDTIPVITSPENLETISTAFTTIGGTATANATMTISITDSSEESTNYITSSDENGDWSETISTPDPGDYEIIVSSNDGSSTLESEITKITTDYDFSSEELSILSHSDGDTFSTSTLELSGLSPNGSLTIIVNSVTTDSITVSDQTWTSELDFDTNTDYEIYLSITNNDTTRTTDIITLTKNDIPTITNTSSSTISNNTFTITGTAQENTALTITTYKPNYSPQSGTSSNSITNYETIIGTTVSDEDGNWSIEVPIEYSGTYSFIVYEDYGDNNQITSNTYSYDLNIENYSTTLMLAPSPYNPTTDSLKIQYQLSEETDVAILIYSISGYKLYESTFSGGSNGALIGQNTITWDGIIYNGNYIPPGLYIVILKVGSNSSTEIKTKRLGVKW